MTPVRRTGAKSRHFGIERWVDFARGLEPECEATGMSDHAARCAACHDLMTFCVKLNAAASALSRLPATPAWPKRS
jgi:hypothetical protein